VEYENAGNLSNKNFFNNEQFISKQRHFITSASMNGEVIAGQESTLL
jgi:hypothetical protein